MMRALTIGFIIASLSSPIFAQIENVCTISSIKYPSSLSEEKREDVKSTELARIAVVPNNEGPLHSQTLKIPKTPLYAHVRIFFDDNMDFFVGLAQAMNVEIVLSSRRNLTDRSTITSTDAQLTLDKYFKGHVCLFGKWRDETININVTCVGPKPKPEE